MKERPILFSSPMVKALLAGTKTQTRRLMKPQPAEGAHMATEMGCALHEDHYGNPIGTHTCPYGGPGDRLWVRENWTSGYGRGCWGTIFQADGVFVQGKRQHPKGIHYSTADRPPGMKWRPSIHLPRWASRITLEVKSVRVERLQDISEDDAKAEGAQPLQSVAPDQPLLSGGTAAEHPYRLAFAVLWDTINGDRASWLSNPWLWVVGFRRLP